MIGLGLRVKGFAGHKGLVLRVRLRAGLGVACGLGARFQSASARCSHGANCS